MRENAANALQAQDFVLYFTKKHKKLYGSAFMKCMYCGCMESKVIDSRATDEGRTIRRRRECIQCGKRFTTYETIETTPVLVV